MENCRGDIAVTTRPVDVRQDVDGGYYAKADFIHFYGGTEEWHARGDPPDKRKVRTPTFDQNE